MASLCYENISFSPILRLPGPRFLEWTNGGPIFVFMILKPCPLISTQENSPAGMDASQMHLWVVSCSISQTSQRGLICKSLRRLRWDVLKISPRRRLWDLSGLLRDISELHLTVKFVTFKLRHFLATCWST